MLVVIILLYIISDVSCDISILIQLVLVFLAIMKVSPSTTILPFLKVSNTMDEKILEFLLNFKIIWSLEPKRLELKTKNKSRGDSNTASETQSHHTEE